MWATPAEIAERSATQPVPASIQFRIVPNDFAGYDREEVAAQPSLMGSWAEMRTAIQVAADVGVKEIVVTDSHIPSNSRSLFLRAFGHHVIGRKGWSS